MNDYPLSKYAQIAEKVDKEMRDSINHDIYDPIMESIKEDNRREITNEAIRRMILK